MARNLVQIVILSEKRPSLCAKSRGSLPFFVPALPRGDSEPFFRFRRIQQHPHLPTVFIFFRAVVKDQAESTIAAAVC